MRTRAYSCHWSDAGSPSFRCLPSARDVLLVPRRATASCLARFRPMHHDASAATDGTRAWRSKFRRGQQLRFLRTCCPIRRGWRSPTRPRVDSQGLMAPLPGPALSSNLHPRTCRACRCAVTTQGNGGRRAPLPAWPGIAAAPNLSFGVEWSFRTARRRTALGSRWCEKPNLRFKRQWLRSTTTWRFPCQTSTFRPRRANPPPSPP
jgi:hypothetical protein